MVTENELCIMQHNNVTLKHLFDITEHANNYFIHTPCLCVRKFINDTKV